MRTANDSLSREWHQVLAIILITLISYEAMYSKILLNIKVLFKEDGIIIPPNDLSNFHFDTV